MEQSARKYHLVNTMINVDLGAEIVRKAQFSVLILNIYCVIKTATDKLYLILALAQTENYLHIKDQTTRSFQVKFEAN